MENKYKIELFYGYEETESGVFHAFEATDPAVMVDFEEMGQKLAEALEVSENSYNFNWDSMYIALPSSLIERIKKDAIEEYLESFND